ncbi:MAG TPA: glycosyltransferase [Methylomirabilota bacterium]|nr:glycosyltransferase [Methylomirabilota bacterium]
MTPPRPGVLLVGDTLNLGGTEGQFAEVACGLDRSRWDLDVCCVRAEGPLRARLEAAGLRAWSVGPRSFRSPALAGAILRLARHLRRHTVRLVHCFDFYSNILGVSAARLAGTPVVIASQRDMGNLRSRGQQAMHSLALGLATHVLVNSDAIATSLARTRAARRGRLAVIHNGVDLARFTPVANGSSGRAPVTVGTLANLRPEKGLRQLVEAAAEVARTAVRARFVIWGDGPLRGDLEALIRARGLTGIVEMPGPTRQPESALKGCDVFVLPSLSEASSNVVLEAMGTGLPVVATRVGGLPGLVEDDSTGLLVPPNDVPSLARAILRLLETPGLAATMGARGRVRVLAEFSLERMSERVDAFYCRTLGPGQGAPAPREAVQRA